MFQLNVSRRCHNLSKFFCHNSTLDSFGLESDSYVVFFGWEISHSLARLPLSCWFLSLGVNILLRCFLYKKEKEKQLLINGSCIGWCSKKKKGEGGGGCFPLASKWLCKVAFMVSST